VTGPDPDRQLMRRARRAIGLQTAAAIVLSVLAVGVLALIVVTRAQQASIESALRRTAATEDDVDDPPPGMWIVQENSDGRITSTEGTPKGLPSRAELARIDAGGAARLQPLQADGADYLVLTERRRGKTVQIVAGLAQSKRERNRLLAALGAAELVGLGAAALFGTLLARRATTPLAEALARQRRFVADASHELRTPLTQLHTRAQLLARDLHAGATPAEMTDDVDHLVSGTRQLGEVVEDLLLSSQIDRRTEALTPVDIGVVAAGVVAALHSKATERNIGLVFVADPERPTIVTGREAALRRVLLALADNALSHTPPGGHVSIELTSAGPGDWTTIVVRDDGEGFDPADAERIFARFARAGDTDQRRFGLGLALAREVVTGHGGTVAAEAHPGRGAVFTVRLPAEGSSHNGRPPQ
jgi:signal transduction histidine kinase